MYDYDCGYCHYFAKILRQALMERGLVCNFYCLLATRYDSETGESDEDVLIHVYVQSGDVFMDIHGIHTNDVPEKRMDTWIDIETQNQQLEDDPLEFDVYTEPTDEIPSIFFYDTDVQWDHISLAVEKFINNNNNAIKSLTL